MNILSNNIAKATNAARLVKGHIRAFFPSIRNIRHGDQFDTPGRKHVVFVHYDPVGQIHDYVIRTLHSLRECGFEVTFVSNSKKLPEKSISLLKPLTRVIIHRYNSGYDFAAYRDGIRQVPELDDCDALILMNDSMYGPLFSLKEQLDKISPDDVDVWGITDSWEFNYHIQGYFILLFNRAIISKSFRKFWRKFPNVNNKHWVIKHGEIKFTQVLARDKLRIGVQCPYWQVAGKLVGSLGNNLRNSKPSKRTSFQNKYLKIMENQIIFGVPMNQSHIFWETIIRDWDCLFIKRELIQKNPLGVPLVWRWKEVIEECTDYDAELIERHLHSL